MKTIQKNYPQLEHKKMTKLSINFNADSEKRFPLYHHYDGSFFPQPAYIQLDCRTGEVTADFCTELGAGRPADVWNNLILRFGISSSSHRSYIAEVINENKKNFQKILDGFSVEWDGSNDVGCFTDEASALIAELGREPFSSNDCYVIDEDELESFLGDELYDTSSTDINEVVKEALSRDGEKTGSDAYYTDDLLIPENMKQAILNLWEQRLYSSETISKNIAQMMIDESNADYGSWQKELIEFAES